MILDPITLTDVGGFIAVLCGGVLLVMGFQYQATRTAAVWGLTGLFAAGGLVLFAMDRNDLGFGSAIVAAMLHWLALANFHGRKIRLSAIVAGAAVWLVVSFAPLGLSLGWRVAIDQLVFSSFLFAAAYELWHGRAERLSARWPLFVLMAIHASVFLVGGITTGIGAIDGPEPTLGDFWMAVLESIIFIIGSALFLVALIKERRINEEKEAAAVDSLTGLPNRGAFFGGAQQVIEGAHARLAPVTTILFDLDSFKLINDTFGHRVGDAVLQRFASVVGRCLRREDVVGRVGGEEFAVVLPGAGREAAVALAERIRTAFAEDCKWVDGQPVKATVSAGIAFARPDMTLDAALEASDLALYAAKAKGRNRVLFNDGSPIEPESVIIRFA